MRISKKIVQLILICIMTLSLTGCNNEFKEYNILTFNLVDVDNTYIDPIDGNEYSKLDIEVTNKSEYTLTRLNIGFDLYDKKGDKIGSSSDFYMWTCNSKETFRIESLIDKKENLDNIEVYTYTYMYNNDLVEKSVIVNLSDKKIEKY